MLTNSCYIVAERPRAVRLDVMIVACGVLRGGVEWLAAFWVCKCGALLGRCAAALQLPLSRDAADAGGA